MQITPRKKVSVSVSSRFERFAKTAPLLLCLLFGLVLPNLFQLLFSFVFLLVTVDAVATCLGCRGGGCWLAVGAGGDGCRRL